MRRLLLPAVGLALVLCACGPGADTVELRFVLDGSVSEVDAAAVETIAVTLDLPGGSLERTFVVDGAFADREASLGLPIAGRSGTFGVRGTARIGTRDVAMGRVDGARLESGTVRVVLSASGPPSDAGVDAGPALDDASVDAGPTMRDAGVDAGPEDAAVEDAGVDAAVACGSTATCRVGVIEDLETSTTDTGVSNSVFTQAIIDGNRWVWGSNSRGQLGDGSDITVPDGGAFDPRRTDPRDVGGPPAGARWVDVTSGYVHGCGINDSGMIFCWGADEWCQLGACALDTSTPTAVPIAGETFVEIDAGSSFTCARSSVGNLYCWGQNDYGQAGAPVPAAGPPVQAVPVQVLRFDGGSAWSAFSCGGHTACGVTPSGTVECWGENTVGQLGQGTGDTVPTGHPFPAAIADPAPGLGSFRSVSVGDFAACAIRAGGEGFCWGHAQVTGARPGPPEGGAPMVAGPFEVTPGTVWTTLSVGFDAVCGIETGGPIRCFGQAEQGTLGIGVRPLEFRGPAAVSLSPDPGFVRVSLSGFSPCASTCDDELFCWGPNIVGEAGRRGTVLTTSPTRTCLR